MLGFASVATSSWVLQLQMFLNIGHEFNVLMTKHGRLLHAEISHFCHKYTVSKLLANLVSMSMTIALILRVLG